LYVGVFWEDVQPPDLEIAPGVKCTAAAAKVEVPAGAATASI
jgi:hypothetical protein